MSSSNHLQYYFMNFNEFNYGTRKLLAKLADVDQIVHRACPRYESRMKHNLSQIGVFLKVDFSLTFCFTKKKTKTK